MVHIDDKTMQALVERAKAETAEVLERLEAMAEENRAAMTDTAQVLAAVAGKRAGAEDSFQESLSRAAREMLQPMDRAALATLSRIGGEKDIADAFDAAIAASAHAKTKYDEYLAENGGYDAHLSPLEKAKEGAGNLGLKLGELQAQLAGLRQDLSPVEGFAERYPGKAGLKTAEDAAYFDSKRGIAHVAALLFDSHYRQGRQLLAGYAAGGTMPEKLSAEALAVAGEAAAVEKERAVHQAVIDDKAPKIEKIRALGRLVQTKDEIRAVMAEAARRQLSQEAILNAAAVALKEYVDEDMLAAFVRIDALRQMENALSARHQALADADTGYEASLGRLREQAKWKSFSARDIGLDDAAAKTKEMTAQALQMARAAEKAMPQIDGFSARGPRRQLQMAAASMQSASLTQTLSAWMTVDMLSGENAVDAASLQGLMRVAPEAALEAGVELAAPAPAAPFVPDLRIAARTRKVEANATQSLGIFMAGI